MGRAGVLGLIVHGGAVGEVERRGPRMRADSLGGALPALPERAALGVATRDGRLGGARAEARLAVDESAGVVAIYLRQ